MPAKQRRRHQQNTGNNASVMLAMMPEQRGQKRQLDEGNDVNSTKKHCEITC
jgi:hypothetical protein